MPITDVAYVIAAFNGTVSANGADIDVRQDGAMEGLNRGLINEATLRFTGAIDFTTGDESYQFFIQEKIGAEYFDVGVFPTIGGAGAVKYTTALLALSAGMLRTVFYLDPLATHIRWRAVTVGTTPIWTGAEIRIHPQAHGMSV